MKCISKLYRSLFNALPLALSFAAGTALAVDLPANYTRLDWIESDAAGLQWIDSGYRPQSTTVIRASILAKTRKGDWTTFFGVMEDDKSNNSVVFRYFNNPNFNGIFCNSNYTEAGIPSTENMEYEVELKSGALTVTGSTAATKTITTVNNPVDAPMYIFCRNNYRSASNTSSPDRHQPMRLYSMTISEGDTQKRNFIPCINDSGAYGLWDAVEGVFYGNKASGADFTGGVIYKAAANEKLTVQNASGTIELRGADAATSEVEVQALAAGSLVYLVNNLKTAAIGSVGSGVNIIVRKIPSSDASVTLALPAGQMIESLTIEDGLTVYLESGSVGSFEGTGKLVVQGDVGYGMISDGIDVKIEADASMSNILDDALASALGEVPALWLDASDATTFQEYTYNGHAVPEGTFPGIVVRRWDDVRGGSDRLYAVNARSSTGSTDGGYIRTMPYSVTNELNGLTVVSFGTSGGNVGGAQNSIDANGNPATDSRAEQRRMVFNQPIASKTIVMVYGSQDGGGMALVGGWKSGQIGETKNPLSGETIAASGQPTYYNRKEATTEAMTISTGRANVPCWVDGSAIVPNETAALDGGYQIISLGVAPGDSPSVRSLGMSDEYVNSGGQRYGEILIFTNELTTVQRKAVEFYLAKKWGLTAGFSIGVRPRSLQIDEGGSFETFDCALNSQHGAGTLSIGGSLEVGGVFAGSVEIPSGAKLVVPASGDVLTEAEIDAMTSKVARFDPDCEDDLEFGSTDNMVHALFDHGNKSVAGTPYLHGYYRDDNNDRRPTYVRSARSFGQPVRGWMDLNADPAGKTQKGNNLRIKTDHAKAISDNGDIVKQKVRTAFIVMDSCYGGGLPVIDAGKPDNTTAVRARTSYKDYTAPIWGSGTSEVLTNGETRINGIAVDGTKTGFTGAPELFSFTTDGNDFNAGVFGFWDAGSDKAFEVFGEIVLFNEVLDAETRGGVEAYLMKKWLDTLPSGYVDWTGATVGGAGTVTAERPKDLPQFENFTGTLEFTAPTLAFTLDGVTKTVAEAFDIGGATLRLAAEGEIALSFADGLAKPGSYTLATFGTLAEPGITNWTYPSRTLDDKYKIRISATNGALVAEVVSPGMCIILR
ncbi:MAG: hypothetical protein IKC14_07735 [Kiritimatiellae bacterium]|nr:hypothetical protein [Kiritimatiellia bacterium]